jgi:hypothetical protein
VQSVVRGEYPACSKREHLGRGVNPDRKSEFSIQGRFDAGLTTLPHKKLNVQKPVKHTAEIGTVIMREAKGKVKEP